LGDSGLFVTQMMNYNRNERNPYKEIIFDKGGTNFGMLMENIVAQMLKSQGHDFYFQNFKYTHQDQKNKKRNTK
jgi:hypothetical protein